MTGKSIPHPHALGSMHIAWGWRGGRDSPLLAETPGMSASLGRRFESYRAHYPTLRSFLRSPLTSLRTLSAQDYTAIVIQMMTEPRHLSIAAGEALEGGFDLDTFLLADFPRMGICC